MVALLLLATLLLEKLLLLESLGVAVLVRLPPLLCHLLLVGGSIVLTSPRELIGLVVALLLLTTLLLEKLLLPGPFGVPSSETDSSVLLLFLLVCSHGLERLCLLLNDGVVLFNFFHDHLPLIDPILFTDLCTDSN